MKLSNKWLLLLGLVSAFGQLSCGCTSAKCLDSQTGKDGIRIRGRRLALNVVHNDRVSSPRRDRTDWKYVELPKAGKLVVQLHWDTGSSRLELAITDVLGVKIQEGRPWGAGGRRAVVAVEEAGRYYIRVRARGKRDHSHYSLRLRFKADGSGEGVCHKCAVGNRECLGKTGYVVCEKVSETCNAWSKTFPCPGGVPCKDGACGQCRPECPKGARRCSTRHSYQVCRTGPTGCPAWGSARSCGKRRCKAGHCGRRTGGRVVTKPPTKPPKAKSGSVKVRIISIYEMRGRRSLHLEIGDNKNVRAGQRGWVLSHDTGKRLPGGEVKITRVQGRYAVAITSLQNIGKNRTVLIKTK
ncbi:MAG: PPC domain-containing protein [Deltaproteobacteria bacterium]|nr:PPC domain-containing protein [Deltaproteobacteria bacterium]